MVQPDHLAEWQACSSFHVWDLCTQIRRTVCGCFSWKLNGKSYSVLPVGFPWVSLPWKIPAQAQQWASVQLDKHGTLWCKARIFQWGPGETMVIWLHILDMCHQLWSQLTHDKTISPTQHRRPATSEHSSLTPCTCDSSTASFSKDADWGWMLERPRLLKKAVCFLHGSATQSYYHKQWF